MRELLRKPTVSRIQRVWLGGPSVRATSVAAVALIALSSGGYADEAFHCPKPETVIAFNNGSPITFTGQAGLECVFKTANGKFTHQFLGLAGANSPFAQNHGERLFPLKVGNEITYTSTANSSHATGELVSPTMTIYYSNTVKVVRQEQLATAAGTFDTYVIEWHEIVLGKGSGAWLNTVWYAPNLGYIVKQRNETLGGIRSGRDLCDYIAQAAQCGRYVPVKTDPSVSSEPAHEAPEAASRFASQLSSTSSVHGRAH